MTAVTADTAVKTHYDAAIAALQLVVDDVLDATTGVMGTEARAVALSEQYERTVLADAAKRCQLALGLLEADNLSTQLAGGAY